MAKQNPNFARSGRGLIQCVSMIILAGGGERRGEGGGGMLPQEMFQNTPKAKSHGHGSVSFEPINNSNFQRVMDSFLCFWLSPLKATERYYNGSNSGHIK